MDDLEASKLISDLRRDYEKNVSPIVKQIERIYASSLPEMIVYERGDVKTEYKFSDQTEEVLEHLKSHLELVQNQYTESVNKILKRYATP